MIRLKLQGLIYGKAEVTKTNKTQPSFAGYQSTLKIET
jgi:hypothetical protein